MRVKNFKNFWAGLMFIVVGGVFAVGALEYSFGSSANPGPGYLPFGLGIILTLLGVQTFVTSLTSKVEGGGEIGAWPIRPGAWIIGAVVLFGLMLPKFGLAISLPVLIGIASFASREYRWYEVLLSAVVLTISSWAIFIKGLGLLIPLWPTLQAG